MPNVVMTSQPTLNKQNMPFHKGMEQPMKPRNLILKYYGNKCAKRSKVPLMNHIEEGSVILLALNADLDTIHAFMLHPIFQNEEDEFIVEAVKNFNPRVITLAKQYAVYANAYLCRPETDTIRSVKDLKQHFASLDLPPMPHEVTEMLYADKIQNRKDFEIYHKGKHERSEQLTHYFDLWIEYLKEHLGMRS